MFFRTQEVNANFFAGELQRVRGDYETVATLSKLNLKKLDAIASILAQSKFPFKEELIQFLEICRNFYRLMALWGIGHQLKAQIKNEASRTLDISEIGYRLKFIASEFSKIFQGVISTNVKSYSAKMKDLLNYLVSFVKANLSQDPEKYTHKHPLILFGFEFYLSYVSVF